MEPPQLVIFDCDGVLVDSEGLAIAVEARFLAELGWPLAEAEIVERFQGQTDSYFRAEIERAVGHPPPVEWLERMQQAYVEAQADLQPVPGIVNALDLIALPTCVASSGTHEKMRRTLGQTGLWARFSGRIFSAHDVGVGKPDPALFLHAAERMGASPRASVVVEDSVFGARAAAAAGMRCLAYAGSPLARKEQLAREGAEVFEDMASLPGLLRLA